MRRRRTPKLPEAPDAYPFEYTLTSRKGRQRVEWQIRIERPGPHPALLQPPRRVTAARCPACSTPFTEVTAFLFSPRPGWRRLQPFRRLRLTTFPSIRPDQAPAGALLVRGYPPTLCPSCGIRLNSGSFKLLLWQHRAAVERLARDRGVLDLETFLARVGVQPPES